MAAECRVPASKQMVHSIKAAFVSAALSVLAQFFQKCIGIDEISVTCANNLCPKLAQKGC